MIERVVAVEIRQAEVERRVARLEDAEANLARKMGEGFERLVAADTNLATATAAADAKLATAVAVVQTRVAIYAGIGSLIGGAAVAAVGRILLGG